MFSVENAPAPPVKMESIFNMHSEVHFGVNRTSKNRRSRKPDRSFESYWDIYIYIYTSNYIHSLRTLYVRKSTFRFVFLGPYDVILSICASLSHRTLFICLYTLPGERQSVVFYRSKCDFLDSKMVSHLHPSVIVA